MKVCRGMNSPMVCSRVFKGTLTKHPRYTMIFSRWIPFIVSKDKGPSLKYSFGFECSDFASCHWQGIVSHSGSWGLRILKLWATNIQGVSEEEFREIHKLGWEKNDTLLYLLIAEIQHSFNYKCRKQTTILSIVLVIFMTLLPVKIVDISMPIHCCFRYTQICYLCYITFTLITTWNYDD